MRALLAERTYTEFINLQPPVAHMDVNLYDSLIVTIVVCAT